MSSNYLFAFQSLASSVLIIAWLTFSVTSYKITENKKSCYWLHEHWSLLDLDFLPDLKRNRWPDRTANTHMYLILLVPCIWHGHHQGQTRSDWMIVDSSCLFCKQWIELNQEQSLSDEVIILLLTQMIHSVLSASIKCNYGHYLRTGSTPVMGDLLDSPVSDRVPRSMCAIILQPANELLTFEIQYPVP